MHWRASSWLRIGGGFFQGGKTWPPSGWGRVKKLIAPEKRSTEGRFEFFRGLAKKAGWIKSWRRPRNGAANALLAIALGSNSLLDLGCNFGSKDVIERQTRPF